MLVGGKPQPSQRFFACILSCTCVAVAAMTAMAELAQQVLGVITQHNDDFPESPTTPVAGSHTLWSKEVFLEHMKECGSYNGTANSIFCLLLSKDAIPGVPVSSHDVFQYRQDRQPTDTCEP